MALHRTAGKHPTLLQSLYKDSALLHHTPSLALITQALVALPFLITFLFIALSNTTGPGGLLVSTANGLGPRFPSHDLRMMKMRMQPAITYSHMSAVCGYDSLPVSLLLKNRDWAGPHPAAPPSPQSSLPSIQCQYRRGYQTCSANQGKGSKSANYDHNIVM